MSLIHVGDFTKGMSKFVCKDAQQMFEDKIPSYN